MSGSGYNLIEMTDIEDNRAGIYDNNTQTIEILHQRNNKGYKDFMIGWNS